ncbi:MAG: hypothetical protein ACLUOI_27515 [Eisenbergiella sp.]
MITGSCLQKLKKSMDTEGMDDYLNTFKYGMPPQRTVIGLNA